MSRNEFNFLYVLSSVGFIEISKDVVYDLLNRGKSVHFVDDNGTKKTKLSNKEVIVTSPEAILKLIERGKQLKMKMSAAASSFTSSHTIFQIVGENDTSSRHFTSTLMVLFFSDN